MEEIVKTLLGMLEGFLTGAATKDALARAGAGPEALKGAVTLRMDPPAFLGASIPQRPAFTIHPSPNFRRAPGREISCVVIHATATDGLESPLGWLCNPVSKVSAHYLIAQDGAVFRLVHEEDVAWHAGVSSWRGRPNVNDFSVGIELVGRNDGSPYPAPQVVACAQLTRAICAERGISPDDVVGHLHVAPGRKTDPAGFDFAYFRGLIS